MLPTSSPIRVRLSMPPDCRDVATVRTAPVASKATVTIAWQDGRDRCDNARAPVFPRVHVNRGIRSLHPRVYRLFGPFEARIERHARATIALRGEGMNTALQRKYVAVRKLM